jgi:hypothetical protein
VPSVPAAASGVPPCAEMLVLLKAAMLPEKNV